MTALGSARWSRVLVKANRQGQTLFASRLDEHYRRIPSLSRLDEAINAPSGPAPCS